MKRISSIIAASAAAILMALPASAKDRSEVLKVYNWSNYIADGVVEDFEKWYEEQTGKKIEVTYMTFDVNEGMLSKIEKGHEDYDVVCPSDYIIERMLNNGILTPLDFSALDSTKTENYIAKYVSPYLREMFSNINPKIDANQYAVPFMWGTTGILYNPAHVTREEASTWNVLRNPKFKGRILLKDAPRDVYMACLVYLKQDELKSGKVTLDELMRDSSDESLKQVKSFLMDCKPGVSGFEADLGKELMTKDRADISFQWSGDAVWAIEEAKNVGVDLDYVVPDEGSMVWFDGWVIPVYAKNPTAATYWIDFMCRPDIALRNMDETGYIASNCAPEVLEAEIDSTYAPIDISYFFGPGAESVCVNPVLYPDKATIDRCALEHDWGEETSKLLSMWQDVKGSRANWITYVIIAAVVVAFIVFYEVRKASKRKRRNRNHRRY